MIGIEIAWQNKIAEKIKKVPLNAWLTLTIHLNFGCKVTFYEISSPMIYVVWVCDNKCDDIKWKIFIEAILLDINDEIWLNSEVGNFRINSCNLLINDII